MFFMNLAESQFVHITAMDSLIDSLAFLIRIDSVTLIRLSQRVITPNMSALNT